MSSPDSVPDVQEQTSVYLPPELKAVVETERKRLGLRSKSEFIREAIIWYSAWLAGVRETGRSEPPQLPPPQND